MPRWAKWSQGGCGGPTGTQVPVEKITEGTQEVSPPIVVVNSARETPRPVVACACTCGGLP